MKYIIYIILGLALLGYTSHSVNAGDVCRTIYGCFGLWVWLNINTKENK